MSSVFSQCLLETAYAVNAETTVYTAAAGTRVKIDKYTVYNSTAGVLTYTVKLVPSGGAAAASNVLGIASIQPAETYTLPWAVGHDLNPGDFISSLCGTASALVHRITGRVTTTS